MPTATSQRARNNAKKAKALKPKTKRTPAVPKMPKRSVEINIDLPSISYNDDYGRNHNGGTFKMKVEGERIEVKAPCGDEVAVFSVDAFCKAAEMVKQPVHIQEG